VTGPYPTYLTPMQRAPRRPPRRRQPRTWLGQDWHRRSVLAPIYQWLIVGLAAMAVDAAKLSPATIRVGGLVLTFAATAAGLLITAGTAFHGSARAYMAGTGLTTCAWITYASLVGVWHTTPGVVWLVLTVIGTGAYVGMRHAQIAFERASSLGNRRPVAAIAAKPAPAEAKDPELVKWEVAFERAGVKEVEVFDRNPTESGFVLHVELPDNVSFDSLLKNDALDTVFSKILKGLPPGSVRIERAIGGDGRIVASEAYVYVDVIEALLDILPHPDDHSPRSVRDLVTIGMFADGTPISLQMNEIHTLIVGLTRWGKSNLLHVLLLALTRCYDAVIWFADFKGGSTILPYVEPFATAEVDPRTNKPLAWPVIDWAAVERTEAERMFLAAIDIASVRPAKYRGNKLEPSRDCPAIFLIVDEIAEAVGAHAGPQFANPLDGATSSQLSSILTRVIMLGTGWGIYVVLAGQRGTVTMTVNGDGKSQMGGRISFKVQDLHEGQQVFTGDETALAAARLAAACRNKGDVAVTGFGLAQPKRGRAFFVGDGRELDGRVREAVFAHSDLIGELDEISAQAADKYGYADRWKGDRAAWARREDPSRPLLRWNTPTAPTVGAQPSPPTPHTEPASNLQDIESPFRLDEPFSRTPETSGTDAELDPNERAAWDALERQFEGGVPGLSTAEATPGGSATSYERFIQIVSAAGLRGIMCAQAYRQLEKENNAPADRTTIYTWRDKAARDSLILVHGKLLFDPKVFHEGRTS
jgi:hypothetical protein